MSTPTDLSEALPDVIAWLRQRVEAEAKADDLTAEELRNCLTESWALAERWRLEQDATLLEGLDKQTEEDDQPQAPRPLLS